MCLTTIVEPDFLEKTEEAAEYVLATVYGIHLAKALDPLKKNDYQKIVRRFGAALRKVNAGEEAKALRAALKTLNVDWPNMTAKQRDAVIRAATSSFTSVPAKTLPKMQQSFELNGSKTIKGTKKSVKKTFKLDITGDFTTVDKKLTKVLGNQQVNFIRDEYGRRRVGFSNKARTIVGDGLELGLGRKEIAADLAKQLTTSTINRNKWYWELISATFTNRSRTYGQLASFQEAAIERYTFVAVMDEATSDVCRFMDGRVFEVAGALQVYNDMSQLTDPEDVKFSAPWVSPTKDSNGDAALAYRQPSGRKRYVARISETGLGTQSSGKYSKGMSNSSLENAGIMMPPLHGFCRSTILPDF